MKYIEGGITAPKGFKAGGVNAGIKAGRTKNDLALIVSEKACAAAGLFTRNRVKAAPVQLDIETVKKGSAKAIIANSGNANACAPNDMENALKMQKLAADALGIEQDEVLVGSTGVIGVEINIGAIEKGLPSLIGCLSDEASGSDEAAKAIMTTDTKKKEQAVQFELNGKTVTLGGISKGSGMIHPNMGTMLCYLTTDCAVDSVTLKKVLKEVCDVTFNRISVDGDTSTNDSLIILANGMAENEPVTENSENYGIFKEALLAVCTDLARRMAADGEGAKHLITCKVANCESEEKAELLSKSVIGSSLTKAAIFGCDANWGRVLCALGYSGADFDPLKVDVDFVSSAGRISVCEKGKGLVFDEDKALEILKQDEVIIEINMNEGKEEATCWGCDLTYDYVKINGDYRT
ncbi:MAG: bifunctional ornithine acetyltransferase/N-acetylglutamate synthase [Solobacterium sp.]|nr:bifunctional ornithine acetyltransferase/N-acetylglutamate synthase [Solobacterium sp.]